MSTGKNWITALLDQSLRGGRLPTLLPPKPVYPACGGVYFMQSSVAPKGPVRVGSTPNIAQSMAHLQAASATPIRLLHYQVIDDEAARLACERAFREHFVTFNIRGDWYKFEIMQHCQAQEIPVPAVARTKTALEQMLSTYGVNPTTSRDRKR